MTRLEHQQDLDGAVAALVQADPRLAPVLERTGLPRLRRREAGFAGLACIIVGQQLSVASAAAVWRRVSDAFGPVEPQAILRTDDEDLRRLGLSHAKTRSLKAIAGEMVQGRLDLDRLATLEADAAHAVLTAQRGIGPWTADIYLLFCLGDADAWPAGDLAVQEAVRAGLDLVARPDVTAMAVLAERWRPVRGAAAHLWWDYYRIMRQRQGILPAAS